MPYENDMNAELRNAMIKMDERLGIGPNPGDAPDAREQPIEGLMADYWAFSERLREVGMQFEQLQKSHANLQAELGARLLRDFGEVITLADMDRRGQVDGAAF